MYSKLTIELVLFIARGLYEFILKNKIRHGQFSLQHYVIPKASGVTYRCTIEYLGKQYIWTHRLGDISEFDATRDSEPLGTWLKILRLFSRVYIDASFHCMNISGAENVDYIDIEEIRDVRVDTQSQVAVKASALSETMAKVKEGIFDF